MENLMSNSPKISIIVPVHNAELYLDESIGSLMNQTLADIEIICVDDASTDNSLNKLNELSAVDCRIKIYKHMVSKSALGARRTGVENANGKYIMFLDADDYFVSDACELLYNKITEEDVDILHFSTKVINCCNTDESSIKRLEEALKPYCNKINGENVFNDCFVKKLYSHTPVNKIYKTELCKKAYQQLEDKHFLYAEDLYAFFAISYYAKSYYGWESKPFYCYYYGRGLSGNATFNINRFEKLCSHADVLRALERFSSKPNINITEIDYILNQYRKEWFDYCIYVWKNNLDTNNMSQGLKLLCDYWGAEETVFAIADKYWAQRKSLSKQITKLNNIPIEDKEIKNIAIYYYRYSVGGAERVISSLIPMFIEMGYNITLVTEEPPTENDFTLPEGVKRIVIEDSRKTNFKNRIYSWKNIVNENSIDLVLYAAWEFAIFFWDMLYLKSIDVSVIMQTHGVFSTGLAEMKPSYYMVPNTYRLADAVIALSNTDKIFYEAYNERVYYIPNPVSENLLNVKPSVFENNAIIWIGRVSEEKNPDAPFIIMKEVAAKKSDAKMFLLGDFYDEKWKKLAEEYNISDNIIFTGLVNNVNDYIQKSSVHLMTSSFEGFPMALVEAKAHGLPTVMFDLPHLELGKPGCGTFNVSFKDYSAAAEIIVNLLNNENLWTEASSKATETFTNLKNYDLKRAWNDVFTGKECVKSGNDLINRFIYTVDNHYEIGITEHNRYTPPKTIRELLFHALKLIKTKGVMYTFRMSAITVRKIILGK